MNLAQAQKQARDDPRIKAAVAESPMREPKPGAGITDVPECEVDLFRLVKDAEKRFRERYDFYLAQGYEVTFGSLSKRIVCFRRRDHGAGISLVTRPAKNPSKGG